MAFRTGRRGRPGCRGGQVCSHASLLDDDDVAGLLCRIRAVAYLIGAATDVEPTQVRTAGWLIESLADEAGARLRKALRP